MGNTDARFNGSIFRKDHPMILHSRRELASIKPIKLQYNASGYAAGTILAVDSRVSLYAPYASNGSNGLNTAVSILLFDVPAEDFVGSASTDYQVERAVFGGEVNKDLLTGYAAGVLTDLKARLFTTALGTNVLKF